jgi:hypothetical protein
MVVPAPIAMRDCDRKPCLLISVGSQNRQALHEVATRLQDEAGNEIRLSAGTGEDTLDGTGKRIAGVRTAEVRHDHRSVRHVTVEVRLPGTLLTVDHQQLAVADRAGTACEIYVESHCNVLQGRAGVVEARKLARARVIDGAGEARHVRGDDDCSFCVRVEEQADDALNAAGYDRLGGHSIPDTPAQYARLEIQWRPQILCAFSNWRLGGYVAAVAVVAATTCRAVRVERIAVGGGVVIASAIAIVGVAGVTR